VLQGDVERVIDAAKAVAIPADQKILHVLPQEYNHRLAGRHPRSDRHVGRAPGAKVHIVTGADSAAQNIVKCVQRCGWRSTTSCSSSWPPATAVLTEDEKDLGVCVVDIAAAPPTLRCSAAARSVTHRGDPDRGGPDHQRHRRVHAHAPTQYAEDIKIRYACALSQLANPDETIEVPSVGDRPPRRLARQTLAEIVEPRYEGTVRGSSAMNCAAPDSRSRWPRASCSPEAAPRWKARIELAEEVFHMPVRFRCAAVRHRFIGGGEQSIHATGVVCCSTPRVLWMCNARKRRCSRAA